MQDGVWIILSGSCKFPFALADRICFPICHCEAPTGPWQTQRGTAASYQLPLKTETAEKWGVAAVSERHVRGIQSYKGSGAPWHPPDVSLRGAKRRGNLAVPSRITGRLSAKS